jgi:hydroxyacylglutathione hydrolase
MTDVDPILSQGPREDMNIWGIGPRLILLTSLFAVPVLAAQWIVYPRFTIQGPPFAVFAVPGSVLIALGLSIWIWASRSVDRAYAEGTLATQGVYALCRHPIYGSAVCFVLPGVLLFFRSWLLLSIPAAAYVICRLLAAKEEGHLLRKFGPAYREYARSVPALFPAVWNAANCFFYPSPTARLDGGVYAVRDGDVNMFLYTDGTDTIAVDSGCSAKSAGRELKRLGVDPSCVTHLFLTHAVPDHAGGLALFPGARIFLPQAEEQMVDGATARFPGLFRNPAIHRPYELVRDGEVVAAGGIRVRAVFTPGHTPGSTSYLADGKALFTGDTLILRNGSAGAFYRLLNMDTGRQRESIRALAALQGVELLCTAHTGWTRDFAKAMAHWRNGGPQAAEHGLKNSPKFGGGKGRR